MKFQALLIGLLFLILASNGEYGGSSVIFSSEGIGSAELNITNVVVMTSPLYQGQSTDFYVTLTNIGTLYGNASVTIAIINSTGDIVSTILYDPVLVAPQTSSIISQSWSTIGYPIGLYLASASATYNDGGNFTNDYNTSFSILALPPVFVSPTPGTSGGGSITSGAGGNVGGSNVTVLPTPTTIPGGLTAQDGNLKFIKSTILKEVMPGDAAFESYVIKNILGGEKKVKLKVSGAPSSWLSFYPMETIFLLGEERVINLGINVPSDALPGDYLLKLEAQDAEKTTIDYTILRVKSMRKDLEIPHVLKTIRLDKTKSRTEVDIDVRNPTKKSLSSIAITEQILSGMRILPSDIFFETKPAYQLSDSNPISIKWLIRQLAPGENARISYSINSLLSEYRPYMYWTIRQVEIMPKEIKPEDLIAIREISAGPLFEGGSSEVTVKVFYSGFDLLHFKAVLETPEIFEIYPGQINDNLVPRGFSILKFKVNAPMGSSGTHIIHASLLMDDSTLISQTGYLTVQKQPLGLSMQLIVIALGLVALMVLSFMAFVKKRRDDLEKAKHQDLREGYIKQIKAHIKREK